MQQFWKTDYQRLYYIGAAVLVVVLITLNYTLGIERYLRSHYSGWWQWVAYMLFYTIPYFGMVGWQKISGQDVGYLRKTQFWVQISLALALLSLDATYMVSRWLYGYCQAYFSSKNLEYMGRLCVSVNSLLTIGLPLLLYWWCWGKRSVPHFYGLNWRTCQLKPYLQLTALALPFIIAASFSRQFLYYYPTLKLYGITLLSIMPPALAIVLYELCYGFDFMWTELMLRGFMVIGLGVVMSRNAVLPMVALYACRHFHKPLGETISSVAGGYVLGCIAFRSNNIIGGVLIHAGIAVAMDLAAMAQWLVRY